MSQQPKRTKYRKVQKGRVKGIASRGYLLQEGSFGLKVLEGGWLTARQLEAVRVTINRETNRQGKVLARVFPDKPITKKPAEVRMGKGKGAPEYWVAVVKPGNIIFEMDGIPMEVAKRAINKARYKLPFRVAMTVRRDYVEPTK